MADLKNQDRNLVRDESAWRLEAQMRMLQTTDGWTAQVIDEVLAGETCDIKDEERRRRDDNNDG